ncbi:MAG: protein-disulfide reductase DsbD domain-containing protein [Hyphomonadaceae bacterium]
MTLFARWITAFGVILAAMLALATPASAQASAKSEHADATLLLERSAATSGDPFLGALHLKLADGWHVYWKNAGDSGLPPTATWANSPAVVAGEFRFPTPEAIPLATLMNYGYEQEVTLPFEIKIAADAKVGDQLSIGGKFEYLICADICIPEDVTLSITLPVAAAPGTDDIASALIAATLPSIPVPLTGAATVERSGDTLKISAVDESLAKALATAKTVRFFPLGPDVENAAPQVVRNGPEGVSIEVRASAFTKPGDVPVAGVIGVETIDGVRRGWETPAVPGAAPAGVATSLFAGAAAPEPTPVMGLAEIAIVLGLAFIGGVALNLMPCVLPVLTIKAAGLVHTAHDPKQSRAHGLAYLGGILVCFAAIAGVLIALQAAGDTSAGFGFQLQYAWVTAILVLVMFAVGLNLLGVFEIGGSLMGVGGSLADRGGVSGAFFTGLLAAFVGAPCIGPFMATAAGAALTQPAPIVMGIFLVIGAGLAAPFVLLSFTPAFAKLLPKPGKWMETFRQVLAFPMFLTTLWLLWVLAGQAGTDGVIAVLGGAIALTFGIWLARKIGQRTLGRVVAAIIILGAFVGPTLTTVTFKAEAAAVTPATWSPERVAALRAEKKVVFVDFTARWCVTCQVNKGAMNDAAVQKTFADLGVVFLEADWTNKDSVIFEELKQHGAGGVPLYLVYPASGGEPKKFDGLLTAGMIQKAVREAAGSI